MLGELFQKVLDMSLIGCYSILIVMAVRLLLSKFERKFTYYLWFVVFLNLCFPLSFQGIFSLIPDFVAGFSVSDAVEDMLGTRGQGGSDAVVIPTLPDGVQGIYNNYNLTSGNPGGTDYLPQALEEETTPLAIKIASGVWLAGIAVLLMWSLAGILRLKNKISRDNWISFNKKQRIAEVAGLDTPFLWGILKPTIYLPTDLEPEEMRYIVAHEQYHKKRKDYLIKVAVFLVVSIHWFNPLVWAAYTLFCRDMEISCDEAVILEFKGNIRKQYAGSLLKYAARQSGFALSPITFGEPAVKTRIKNVLRFRKRGIVISVLTVICVVSVAAGLVLRPFAEEKVPHDSASSSEAENRNDLNGSNLADNDVQYSESVETTGSTWYGSYIVTDYIIRGVTAIGYEEAEGLMMCLMEYGPDEFNSDGVLLENPAYRETLMGREEFDTLYRGSGGGYTFETFGIEGDSLLEVTIDNSPELGNTFYVWDESRILIYHPGGAFLIAERGQHPDIVLTDEQKTLLQTMCNYLPDFSEATLMEDERFWSNFIYSSFTSVPMEYGKYKPIYGEGERVMVYREDWGYEEPAFKISERYVREYVRLILGVEMPEFKPAFEDIKKNQSVYYYQDGYYYIGGSDFGEAEYRFRDLEVFHEQYDTSALVSYDILLHNADTGEQEVEGTVQFHLNYADNANGFVIVGKEVEWD